MKFEKRVRYRFGDIDDAGIAYYPKLLHCFHCVFEDWWSEGLGRAYATVLHEDALGLPAVHLEADFFAPIRYGDEPIVHLGVLRIGESSVDFGFWMTRDGNESPLCRALVTAAAVEMRSLQKCSLPRHWREQFARFAISLDEFPHGRDQGGSSRSANARGK